MSIPRAIGSTRMTRMTTRNGKKRLNFTDSKRASKSWREGTRDFSLLTGIMDAGRSPIHPFLPLALAGFATAVIFVVQWFVGLFSDRGQRFEQHQSTSKGARR